MDTWTRANFKLSIAALGMSLLAACSSDCTDIANRIIITEWPGVLPKKLTLYRFKKDSNFTALLQKDDSRTGLIETHFYNDDRSVLYLTLGAYNELPTNFDYKLIVDDDEYRISKILPGRAGSGCRIPAGKANQCDLEFDDALNFSYRCRVPAALKDR
jgi:hypothetical protein